MRLIPSCTLTIILSLTFFLVQSTAQTDPPAPQPTIGTFTNITIYEPYPSSFPPHTLTLPNATVLTAFVDPASVSTIQIYRSINNGFSWYEFSTVKQDEVTLAHPRLAYVVGSLAGDTGDVVLAAQKISQGYIKGIDIWVSGDGGESWEEKSDGTGLESTIVVGGDLELLPRDSSLSVFYTAGGDKTHGSRIMQQTTTDNYDSWSNATNVVASDSAADLPSDVSIAQIANNKYILAFQYVDFRDPSTNKSTSPIFYKISSDPVGALSDSTRDIRVKDSGYVPQGVPSVTWSSIGGPNGTIVLSDSVSRNLFLNRQGGEGLWEEVRNVVAGAAAGREVVVLQSDQTKVRITEASEGQILVSIIDLEKVLDKAD